MTSFAAVEQDIELARQLASSFYSSFAAKGTSSLNGLDRFVTLCGPFRNRTGTCSVTILLERSFVSSKIIDSNSSNFVVCAEWKVLFGPSYPTEPCTWHFDKDCNTHRNSHMSGDTMRLRVRLRSFLVEEVVSRLSSSSRLTTSGTSYAAACTPDASKHNDYYSFNSRGVNRELSPERLLPPGGTPSLTEDSARLEKKCSDGTIPVPQFLFDFAFLCNWWMSLELDDGCIVPASHQMLHGIASVGNMVATEEEGSGGGFMNSGHTTHFLEAVGGGNRSELPKRGFAAIFTPHGEVLMWGFGRLKKKRSTQGKQTVGDMHSSTSEMNRDKTQSFTPPQLILSVSSSSSYTNMNHNNNTTTTTTTMTGNVSSSTEFTEVRKYSNQRNHYHHHHHHHEWQRLHITSSSSDGTSEVLPSLLVPKNILYTELYRMNDVCLCAEDPATALKKNIRICREGTKLRGVVKAFRMLRQLVKGASPHAPSLYTVQLLAPALHEVVKALQLLQKPFWAGVAICCFTLPSLLSDRPMMLNLDSLLIDPVESHRCVSLVATVFSIVGSVIQFREAEIAKKAIENIHGVTKRHLKIPDKSICGDNTNNGIGNCSPSSSNSNKKGDVKNNSSVFTGHPPITECAVCRLPLPQRPTPIGVHGDGDSINSSNNNNSGSAAASTSSSAASACNGGNKYGNNAMRTTVVEGGSPLSSGNEDGCLTLQCARCGHGGHVDHILAWWDDCNVRCCPMGCDCLCIY
ncbi:uncharacterized protein TM35_000111700 [Trypanosoma theileri]|uniref:Uncharacterized protein n=1 Tax=Trypanosoma theileri TaxID=67003 RepID=A0A1X0NY56_9TRYP|nr:uncharacterized protein TM35_000111700 [Trypanosoma theileri]ORC89636.1 hypothetical protein TM35_000111700 [Trypanosoma theileri]